jgi:ribose 5-phosphate isomerase B
MTSFWIASDHAGFDLKTHLQAQLKEFKWTDLGPSNMDRVDYPDFADRLVKEIKLHGGFGILVCGSGQGMCIRANRDPAIRAALCWNEEIARLARAHNGANVLCLGARVMDHTLCEKIVRAFAETAFEGGRHADRVKKLGLPIS